MIAVAVDDDLYFVVKTDDTFVGTLLFLESVVRYHEVIVDAETVLLLVASLEVLETLNDLRLFDDLISELIKVETLFLLEEL